MGLLDKMLTRLNFYVPSSHLRTYVFLPHVHHLHTVARTLKYLVPPPVLLDAKATPVGRHGGRSHGTSSDTFRASQVLHPIPATQHSAHFAGTGHHALTPELTAAAAAATGTTGVDGGPIDSPHGEVGRETHLAIPIPPPSFLGGCELRQPLAVDPTVAVYSAETMATVIDVALVLAAVKPRPHGAPTSYDVLQWPPGITAAGLIVGLQTAIKRIGFSSTVAYLNRLETLSQCTSVVTDLVHVVVDVCEARVNGVLLGLLPHNPTHSTAGIATTTPAAIAAAPTTSPRRSITSAVTHKETILAPPPATTSTTGAAVALLEARRQEHIAARSFQVALIKWRIMIAAAGRCQVMMAAILQARETRAVAAVAAAAAAAIAASAAAASHMDDEVDRSPLADDTSSSASDSDVSDSELASPIGSSPRPHRNPVTGKDPHAGVEAPVPGCGVSLPPPALQPTSPEYVAPRCKQAGDPATFIGPPWKSTVTVPPPVLATRLLSLAGMSAVETQVKDQAGQHSARNALQNMVLLSEQERARAAKQAAVAIKGSRSLRAMERIQRLQLDPPVAAAPAHPSTSGFGPHVATSIGSVDVRAPPAILPSTSHSTSKNPTSTVMPNQMGPTPPHPFPVQSHPPHPLPPGSAVPSVGSSARSSRVSSRAATPRSARTTSQGDGTLDLNLNRHGSRHFTSRHNFFIIVHHS